MKSKIIAVALWSAAFGSIVYSYLSGNENYAGIGVSLAWLSVILGLFVTLIQAVVLGAGTKQDKQKAKEVYLKHGAFARFIGWLQTSAMFIVLCVTGYWFTAVAYLLMAIIMAAIGYCVRENEKKAETFTA